MLLSIGLITKNEEKYIDKCLCALMPIKNAIESEIIVVDTGSDDKTVEIAKKYTDKVFFFTWCNDFSAARNETLKHCSGEWYLFFDADEILQNPETVIRFFTSGEYKKYQSASYIKRNFTMNDLSCYSDQNTVRLIKRTPDTHFEGIIHEQITPVNSPVKRLDTLFWHFGYLYESETEKTEKAKRNATLLEKELKIRPDAYTYLQLAESLRGLDVQKSIDASMQGLKLASAGSMTMQLLYKVAGSMYHQSGNLDLSAQIIDKYFSLENRNRFIDMEMYSLAGFVLYDMGAYEMCIQYFEAYHTLYCDYHNGGSADAGYTVSCVSPFEYRSAVYTAITACIALRADENAEDWLLRVPLSEFSGDEQDIALRIMIEHNFDIAFSADRLERSCRTACDKVKRIIADSL